MENCIFISTKQHISRRNITLYNVIQRDGNFIWIYATISYIYVYHSALHNTENIEEWFDYIVFVGVLPATNIAWMHHFLFWYVGYACWTFFFLLIFCCCCCVSSVLSYFTNCFQFAYLKFYFIYLKQFPIHSLNLILKMYFILWENY